MGALRIRDYGNTIAIMQPYFFPYLGYFQLVHAVDRFIVYDDVAYIKNGWINRNRIVVNGSLLWLTLPLQHVSMGTPIGKVKIAGSTEKQLRTVELTYRRAPYFDDVYPLLERVLSDTQSNLVVLLRCALREVCSYLGINTTIIESSAGYENACLSGEDRVIDICKKEKANCYINSIGGARLYSAERFAAKGISLRLLQPHMPRYRHFKSEVSEAVSILDMMMFCSKDRMREHLNDYGLIKPGGGGLCK